MTSNGRPANRYQRESSSHMNGLTQRAPSSDRLRPIQRRFLRLYIVVLLIAFSPFKFLGLISPFLFIAGLLVYVRLNQLPTSFDSTLSSAHTRSWLGSTSSFTRGFSFLMRMFSSSRYPPFWFFVWTLPPSSPFRSSLVYEKALIGSFYSSALSAFCRGSMDSSRQEAWMEARGTTSKAQSDQLSR